MVCQDYTFKDHFLDHILQHYPPSNLLFSDTGLRARELWKVWSRSPFRADWVTEPIFQGPLEVVLAARTVGQNLEVRKEARPSEQGRNSSLTGL